MRWADHPATAWVLAVIAFALASASALPYAGGFNDGSRLATSESLIDRGTLAIDDSLFVRPSSDLVARGMPPYPLDLPDLFDHGTLDKVQIDGHFYSDKPMVPAVLTAAAYRLLMVLGLPSPAERPDVFCRVAPMLTCGLAYAVTVGCMWVLGKRSGLTAGWRFVWLAGFALATVLPAYTRQVNAGLPQTAAVAGLAVLLSRAAGVAGRTPWAILAGAGFCAGFGYAVDQASGAPLVAISAIAVAFRTRRVGPVVVFALAAFPWIAAHHALNYAVGHVWVPLGLVPEYLAWPGSPFDPSNMTGFARHTPLGLVLYARDMMLGWNGLLICNLPLLLAAAFGWLVLVRPRQERGELVALLAWCAAVWAIYAVLSDNFGGGCLTVRWFVPFLVPGFWLLARLLAEWPSYRADFLALTAGGMLLGYEMWTVGPWPFDDVPHLSVIVWSALGTWAAVRAAMIIRWRRRLRRG